MRNFDTMRKKIIILFIFTTILSAFCIAQPATKTNVITGADRLQIYLPMLKGKTVAVFANQTSMVGNTHLVDILLKNGVNIVKIFGPEHGFRGNASAGEHVEDGKDKATGLPIISLYGEHKKPTAEDLKDVDMVIFDIQDVGVRFYTYISSLEYLLAACAENNKPLMILDRPNPNGFYVDGPVLDKKFKSFIGLQEIPIVYGMTIGEYAQMIVGENKIEETDLQGFDLTIDTKKQPAIAYDYDQNPIFAKRSGVIKLTIITCQNYTHNTTYILPVNPSPNLRNMAAIYLYPSTCFFEGTIFSEGRGTNKPFQVYGHPNMPKNLFSFTPMPNEGAKSSKCYFQKCYGYDLSGSNEEVLKKVDRKIQLKYFISAYKIFSGKDTFFLKNNFIDKLTGNAIFQQQIKAGKTEAEIRKSWQPGLTKFKAVRKKYLLYKDFE